MTPDMPVIKGPAERCAESLDTLGYLRHPLSQNQVAALIRIEYDSERREMVRVMETAAMICETEAKALMRCGVQAPRLSGAAEQLRAAIAKLSH